MRTELFLKNNHGEIISGISKEMFNKNIFLNPKELYANQPEVDTKVLSQKLKGSNHSICYVYEINEKRILIDGHHTIIAKILLGKQKVKVKFLKK